MTIKRVHGGEFSGRTNSVSKAFALAAVALLAFVFVAIERKQMEFLVINTQAILSMDSPSVDNHSVAPVTNALVGKEGWKTIHVFYGDEKHANTKGKSQCKQDDLVLGLLRNQKNGYFLDLAANDAVSLSNTYKLEQVANWTGVCIEANHAYWRPLSYRRCHVVGAVVGETRMEELKFKFHEGTSRLPGGGIERDDFDNKPGKPKTKSKAVPLYAVPLLEILEGLQAPKVLDYFSLDVEGAESFIMMGFPFEKYRFRIMTVERPKQDLVNLLYSHGYRYVAAYNEWGDETLWVHSQDMGDLDMTAIASVGWFEGDTKKLTRGATPDVAPTLL